MESTTTIAGATTLATLHRTPLFENHLQRAAKVVDFAGWAMPLQFGKVLAEHQAVRQAAGLFDISHMGLVLVRSGDKKNTQAFLNALVPQDLNKLTDSKAVYTQFLNEQGGILDDIIVYQLSNGLSGSSDWQGFDEFLVICNAGNTPTDMAWMKQHASQWRGAAIDVTLVSEQYCLFALQGPKFEAVLNTFPDYQADTLVKRFHIGRNQLGNTPVLLARTGYTGEDGVEIIVPQAHANTLWNQLLENGGPMGLQPIGLAARDTLRLEAAYPLHGHDIHPGVTPLEAGLGWSVKLTPENTFIGKDALLRQQAEGIKKRFYCLKIKKKSIAREHDRIFINGKPAGEITSGSISPLSNEAIAMGYITTQNPLKPGETILVEVRGKLIEAEIVERPFYKKS